MAQSPENKAKLLYKALLRALNSVRKQDAASDTLLSHLRAVQLQRSEKNTGENPSMLRAATNAVLTDAINDLEQQNPRCAQVLRERFFDEKTLQEVANSLYLSADQVSRLQRSGIEQLEKIIEGREEDIVQERIKFLEDQLPPPSYSRLFGVDEIAQDLLAQLRSPTGSWVAALVGMGGIGKTALADFATRILIQELDFFRVIWLRAEPPHSMSGRSTQPRLTYEKIINELMARLAPNGNMVASLPDKELHIRRLLKERTYLVIVDDLEAEEDTAFLLHHLTDFANPTKFLLTTRTGIAKQAAVTDIQLDELSLADAADFMRYYAAEKLKDEALAKATVEDIERIYAVVGGNPHAIKMVMAQLVLIPLPHLLQKLTHNIPKDVEKMYTHIYKQSWETLSENGRQLLRAMPLVSDPAGADYLLSISGLTESELWPAIEELRHRSLLEVQGTLHERLYGIHFLTNTFLRTEIINLSSDAE